MATFAPSAARRFAIAAPMPREPPVTSATLFTNFDMESPLLSLKVHYFVDLVDSILIWSFSGFYLMCDCRGRLQKI
jgi:hypothetical protein